VAAGVGKAAALLAGLAATGLIGGVGCHLPLTELRQRFGRPREFGPVDGEPGKRWIGYGHLQLQACGCEIVTHLGVPVWHGKLALPRRGGGRPVRRNAAGLGLSHLAAALDAAGYTEPPSPSLRGQLTLDRIVGEIRTEYVFVTTSDGFTQGPLLKDPELYKVISHSYHDCPAPGR
jgi:hypothetical protein